MNYLEQRCMYFSIGRYSFLSHFEVVFLHSLLSTCSIVFVLPCNRKKDKSINNFIIIF